MTSRHPTRRPELVLRVALTAGLAVAGCPSSHGGLGPDAGSGGTDAPPGADAPLGPECDVPSACLLRSASCCGACGAPTPTDMIALPVEAADAYAAAACAGVGGCPACAAVPDPYLLATCEAGTCVAIDLHAHPLTECTLDADCVLSPARCCACGLLAAHETIAHNPARGGLGTLTCDPDADCPPCVPDFGTLEARCDAGRCTVVAPGP